MKVLPWVLVAGLAITLGWAYSTSQRKDAELATLREDRQQLQKLKAEAEEAKAAAVKTESDELTRLRKDNEELLRLRNEVRQLRSDKQQLTTQARTAQAQAQNAQEQIQALRQNAAQASAADQQAAAQAAFRARYGLNPATPEQAQTNACINNLRLLDGAKQQWALENRKAADALPTTEDLLPYMKSGQMPICPAGGHYELNAVGLLPTCTIPGHALQK